MDTATRGIRVTRVNKSTGMASVKLDGVRIGRVERIEWPARSGMVAWRPLPYNAVGEVVTGEKVEWTLKEAVTVVYEVNKRSEAAERIMDKIEKAGR